MMTIFLGVSFFNEKIQRLHIISAALFLGGLLLITCLLFSIQWQGVKFGLLGCALFILKRRRHLIYFFKCQKFLSPFETKIKALYAKAKRLIPASNFILLF